MKKLRIDKKLRLRLLLVLSCLSLVFLALTIKMWTSPGVMETKVPLYSYNHKADLNYKVYLNPNPIYDQEMLDKGQFYLMPFVNYINTNFTYTYNGDKPAEIKGDYEVVAYMQGVQRELDKLKIIWSKAYRILPRTTFEGRDKQLVLNKEIPIELKSYNDFILKLQKDYQIPTEVQLNIYWNVNIEAKTEQGTVKEQLAPRMTIPLNVKYFEIGGDLSKAKNGSLDTTVISKAPVKTNRVATCGVFSVILILGLFFILKFTFGDDLVVNQMEKQWKKTQKNYGERLVALDDHFAIDEGETLLTIQSFADIVRIADELSKPILYKYSAGQNQGPVFYVINEPRIYTCQLELIEDRPVKWPSLKKITRIEG